MSTTTVASNLGQTANYLDYISVLFLAASIVGMIHTCYTLPIRLVQSSYVEKDPGAYSIVFCKFAWFTNFSLR